MGYSRRKARILIIKKFVDKNCVNPSNSKRKIERLEIAPDKKEELTINGEAHMTV